MNSMQKILLVSDSVTLESMLCSLKSSQLGRAKLLAILNSTQKEESLRSSSTLLMSSVLSGGPELSLFPKVESTQASTLATA